MERIVLFSVGAVLGLVCSTLDAQLPQLINYQGRLIVGTTNFGGTGLFKFALVDGAGTTTYWSNDGTSTNGSEPTNAVSVTVNNGLYSVLLGSTSAIPKTVFNNPDVRLRVWFNDGSHGSQLLSPDQRVATVGYAFMAASVGDTSLGPSSGPIATTNGDRFTIKAPGGIRLLDDVNVTGVLVPDGGINTTEDIIGIGANFSGEVRAGSFVTTSDRSAKEQFRPVNAREILSRLTGIPIQTWNFKQDDSGVPHIGPMAQDFYTAFHVGPDDKHIATVDADGVAFAAIQGLNEIVREQSAELVAKAKKIDALEKRLDEIERNLKHKTTTKRK
jgi:Chaperone of endosialidase